MNENENFTLELNRWAFLRSLIQFILFLKFRKSTQFSFWLLQDCILEEYQKNVL